jgi:hypothetical protein
MGGYEETLANDTGAPGTLIFLIRGGSLRPKSIC